MIPLFRMVFFRFSGLLPVYKSFVWFVSQSPLYGLCLNLSFLDSRFGEGAVLTLSTE